MAYEIPMVDFPKEVEISLELIAEERAEDGLNKNENRNSKKIELDAGFHEKKGEKHKNQFRWKLQKRN